MKWWGREKRAHGITAKVLRVLLVVKKDVPLDPSAICLFGPQAEMTQTRNLTHFVEKLRLSHREGL